MITQKEFQARLGKVEVINPTQEQLKIINESEEHQWASLKHPDLGLIDFIENPTEEMIFYTIKKSQLGIVLIKNPTSEMVKASFQTAITMAQKGDGFLPLDETLNMIYEKIIKNDFDPKTDNFRFVFESQDDLTYFLNVVNFSILDKKLHKLIVLSTESDGLTIEQENNIGGVLCKILRHDPEKVEISLDREGWTDLNTFIRQVNVHCKKRLKKSKVKEFTLKMMMQMHDTDRKDRYELSDDCSMVRCKQGHSYYGVDIQHEKVTLEHDLYHGTSPEFYDSIMEQGLVPKSRHYVHLSKDIDTAFTVGMRHSKPKDPIIFVISKDTPVEFFVTKNGVFHAKAIPPEYLTLLED